MDVYKDNKFDVPTKTINIKLINEDAEATNPHQEQKEITRYHQTIKVPRIRLL